MLIKSIELKNFRNFKKALFEFPCNDNKNFTIVFGENTFGKTTLVKSFLWCLYHDDKLFDDKILLNKDVQNAMSIGKLESVSVTVKLEHKDYKYTIKTEQKYSKGDREYIYPHNIETSIFKVYDSGQSEYIENPYDIKAEIDGILSKELRGYFFFDGETNLIENIVKKANLTKAVSNITELALIEDFKKYYNPDPTKKKTVIAYLRKEKDTDDELTLNDLRTEMEFASVKKDEIETEIESSEQEINKLTKQRDENEEKLNTFKEIGECQKKKLKLESDITRNKEKMDELFNNTIQDFNKNSSFLKILFCSSFTKNKMAQALEKFITEFKHNENSYKYSSISKETINHLIDSGRCICGAEIVIDSDTYKNLIQIRDSIAPINYSGYIDEFIANEELYRNSTKNILGNINDDVKNVIDKIQQISDDEEELESVKNKIKNQPNISDIQNENDDLNALIHKTNGIIEARYIDLLKIKKDIQNLAKEIEDNAAKTQKNEFINLCIKYAESIYKSADELITKKQKEMQSKMEEAVNKYFQKIYTGNRTITIDENFKVDAKSNDEKLDTSTGLKTVINYSFVVGLMDLAKQNIIKSSDFADDEKENDVYPLVIDAPFSNVDADHTKNICKVLANYCDQIIMFVSRKDYEYAKATINDKIGKIYKLKKIDETNTEVEAGEI